MRRGISRTPEGRRRARPGRLRSDRRRSARNPVENEASIARALGTRSAEGQAAHTGTRSPCTCSQHADLVLFDAKTRPCANRFCSYFCASRLNRLSRPRSPRCALIANNSKRAKRWGSWVLRRTGPTRSPSRIPLVAIRASSWSVSGASAGRSPALKSARPATCQFSSSAATTSSHPRAAAVRARSPHSYPHHAKSS